MSETAWKPIETARKDYDTILVASPKRTDAVTVIWNPEDKCWKSNVYPYLAFEDGFFTHWTEAPDLPTPSPQ